MNPFAKLLQAVPPEGRLLARCISLAVTGCPGPNPYEPEALNVDWERVAEYAEGHFVVPPVYTTLSEHYADAVPATVLKRLRHAYARNTLAHRWLAQELVQISNALDSSGGRLIALKGPALAVQAYGDLAARQSGDMDVFVRARELPRIAELLVKRGYRPRRYRDGAPDLGFYRSFEDQFVSERGQIVDLHLTLVPTYFPLPMGPEAVWRDAVAIELAGGEVATLSPNDQLIFAIVHAAKHGWGWAALRSVCDIAALAESGLVDWETIEHEMTRAGCARMLRLGAVLSHAFAAARVPENLLKRSVADGQAMDLASGIARRLFPAPGLWPSMYCDWIVPMRTIEGMRRRVQYLLTRGLRPTVEDMEALPLPRGLRWAYCLTRPIRLAVLHTPRLLTHRREFQG